MASLDEVYGSNFCGKKSNKSKKNKLKSSKYINNENACDYYAKQYIMSIDQANKQKQELEYNIDGNDYINYFAEYDNGKRNLSNTKQKLLKNNNNKDIDEFDDYFEKLYGTYDFPDQERNNGRNFMSNSDNEKEDNNDNYDNNQSSNYKEDIDKFYKSNIDYDKYSHIPINMANNYNDNYYEKDKYYMDFGLYLISGILLIFILEQFVHIGLVMQNKRNNEKILDNILQEY